MDINLSSEEVRILGALMEKEVTTPEYYPMTLNSLVAACNQKSCREPVMTLDESAVTFHLDVLRDEKKLVALVSGAGSRVAKFKQRLTESFFFTPGERAVLCELMLRGPQTAGELRNRADRMHAFAGSEEVQASLRELETRPDGPWVVLLPRMAGHKEARYLHLLAGRPEASMTAGGAGVVDSGAPASSVERLARLEQEVQQLTDEMVRIRTEFDAFRKQFGS